jgi:hypothetical protein
MVFRIGGGSRNAKRTAEREAARGCILSSRRVREMKVRHLLHIGAVALLSAALASCVLPNTATLQLKNSTGHAITAAYFNPAGGTPPGTDRLYGTETIANGDSHSFLGITPGTYDITLAVEGHGTYVAFTGLALEENHWVYENTPALP